MSISSMKEAEKLKSLLMGDLDFQNQISGYGSHNFHSFPAKFPPQLPRKFIEELTSPGDIVLDPMIGSGTTAVEALSIEGKPILGLRSFKISVFWNFLRMLNT